MAGKLKAQTASSYVSKSKKRGKHSKKESNNKASKNYTKQSRGQGK
jgi:hypothetical protein